MTILADPPSTFRADQSASAAILRIPTPESQLPLPAPEFPDPDSQISVPHPALELVVGPGVRAAMAAAGDEPRGHEEYVHDQETGSILYSLTHGRDALYRWTPQDGVKRLPFEAAASSDAARR